MESSQNELETRWANLLQPIKDMAKNWDVDLETILQKYLSEISNTMITFDGGITVMNFAEAGLMIQRSTDVYRRKVDYLHSLVFQALEVMNNKKKKMAKENSDGDGDVESQDDQRDDDDDDLQVPVVESHHKTIMTLEQDNEAWRNAEENLVPLIPPMFLPRGEAEKGRPLVGRNGEVFANTNDFWMNTSVLDKSGTLLLSRHLEYFIHQLIRAQDNMGGGGAAAAAGNVPCGDADNDDGCADDNYDDDGGMGAMVEGCETADGDGSVPPTQTDTTQQPVSAQEHATLDNAERRADVEVEVRRGCEASRKSAGIRNPAVVRSREEEAEILAKFYTLLDPYKNDTSATDPAVQVKPCRPGKTYKLSEGLLKLTKRGGGAISPGGGGGDSKGVD